MTKRWLRSRQLRLQIARLDPVVRHAERVEYLLPQLSLWFIGRPRLLLSNDAFRVGAYVSGLRLGR